MLVFIVLYAMGFITMLELALITTFSEDATTPVLTSFAMAFTWPLYVAHYVWVGCKMFAHHMLVELGLR